MTSEVIAVPTRGGDAPPMSDITTTVTDDLAAFNATDPGERRALVAKAFADDTSYVDPVMAGRGTDELAAMIGGAQEQFPGCTFRLASRPDAHYDRVRFSWHLVADDAGTHLATGHDFATVASDGRLQDVTGFLAQPA